EGIGRHGFSGVCPQICRGAAVSATQPNAAGGFPTGAGWNGATHSRAGDQPPLPEVESLFSPEESLFAPDESAFVAQPPLPWQELFPLQPLSPALQPPCPLQEFWPLQLCWPVVDLSDAWPLLSSLAVLELELVS